MTARLTVLLATLPCLALAAEGPTITFKPGPDSFDDRPVATQVSVGPQGSNIALELLFDRLPWGDECKNRCANATIFLDTDGNPSTGLKLAGNLPENGADLAVTVQGAREYTEQVAEPQLRVKVRKLNGTLSVDDSAVIADFNQRTEADRVQSEDERVFVLLDATSTSLPAGPTMRVIYHPPGSTALTATVPGMRAKGRMVITLGQEAAEEEVVGASERSPLGSARASCRWGGVGPELRTLARHIGAAHWSRALRGATSDEARSEPGAAGAREPEVERARPGLARAPVGGARPLSSAQARRQVPPTGPFLSTA